MRERKRERERGTEKRRRITRGMAVGGGNKIGKG